MARPTSLNFGSLESDQQASRSVTLTNIANLPIDIGTVSIAGAGVSIYEKTSSSCEGITLHSDQACAITVEARNPALGVASANLELDLDAGASVKRVPLTTRGVPFVPEATISASPGAVDFGIVMPGAIEARTVLVTNNGPEPAEIVHISRLSPSDKVPFAFGVDASACLTGDVLPVGESCEIQVSFDGSEEGVPTGTLRIMAENREEAEVSLRGQGPTPTIELSTDTLTLDATSVMGTSAPQTVTITNVGEGALHFQGIGVSGEFGLTSSCPVTLVTGASCLVSVTHKPVTAGVHTGTLSIRTNDLARPTATVALSSQGDRSALRAEPTAVVINQPSVGVAATQVFSLVNEGPGDAYLSRFELLGADATRFSYDRSDCGAVLAAGDSCQVSVRFTPTEAGRFVASLRITQATEVVLTVPITGQGPAAQVSISETVLAFGNQLVNTASASQAIVLQNEGASPVRIKSIHVNGILPRDSGYPIDASACPALLPVGGACAVQVVFAPDAPRAFNETLIVSTANSAGDHQVSLTGRGLAEAGKLALENSTGDFGNLALSAAHTQMVTLVNVGSSPLQVVDIQLPDTGMGVFERLSIGTCSFTTPFTLSPGRSCSVALQATALSLGGD